MRHNVHTPLLSCRTPETPSDFERLEAGLTEPLHPAPQSPAALATPSALGQIARSIPDSFMIGVLINAVGAAVVNYELEIPPDKRIIGIYLAVGTLIGATYFQGKAVAARAVRLAADLCQGHRATDLPAPRGEPASYGTLDPSFTRRFSRCDLERIGQCKQEQLLALADRNGLDARAFARLSTAVRGASNPDQRRALVDAFVRKTGAPGLAAILELSTPAPTLNAQAEIEEHLAQVYSPELAVAVSSAIAEVGAAPQIAHPTTAEVTVPPAVRQTLLSLAHEPNSGVALDHEQCPVLVDRAKAPAVLTRLARALPAQVGQDAALLIDGSNGDRIYFGVQKGNYIDAISAAVMLAGTGRSASHSDPETLAFLHDQSVVWTLNKSPLGLAAAQWSNLAEVHHLLPAPEDQKLGAAFEAPNYRLYGPEAHAALPGIAEARAVAAEIAGGRAGQETPAAVVPAAAMRWPERGSLLIDPSLLRLTEAFVRNLGRSGRVDTDGRIYIGGPRTPLSETHSLAICADLALVLSAAAKTDGGVDAGGPFGSVLWNPATGEATIGKNQVVPSNAAVNHGERVGLFLRPHEDGSWLVTSAEPCAMCFLACSKRRMKIAFVVTSAGVEANTEFKEGKKDYAAAPAVVLGPERYTDAQGRETVHPAPFLAERAPLGETILRLRSGANYAVS